VHACVRGCVLECVRGCVCACVRGCVRACVRACIRDCVRAWLRACLPLMRACVRVLEGGVVHTNFGQAPPEYQASFPNEQLVLPHCSPHAGGQEHTKRQQVAPRAPRVPAMHSLGAQRTNVCASKASQKVQQACAQSAPLARSRT
jgi:hypothetical protein